ncbi:MAG: hypothetical protein KAS07_03660 [Candidatus Pacebacteria bacterium]|nr:hypothetical protein [Candidatus Paceibacterota bacterium]
MGSEEDVKESNEEVPPGTGVLNPGKWQQYNFSFIDKDNSARKNRTLVLLKKNRLRTKNRTLARLTIVEIFGIVSFYNILNIIERR